MRMTKKILAIALSVLMTVSMMPFTVLANGGVPTATVTPLDVDDLPGDTSGLTDPLEIAYQFKANDTYEEALESAYKDYFCDFVVTFDEDIPAGAVKLAGSYESYQNGKWVQFDAPAINAGEPFRLLQAAVTAMGLDSQFTYADICKVVKEFNCGATGLNAAGVKMTVSLNLYEDEDDQEPAETIADEDYTFPVNTDEPTATVTPISVEGLEVAYSFTPDQTVEEAAISSFRNYIADFTVSFDQDIPAGAVKLAGSYQGYKDGEWVEITLPALEAGQPYRLLENAVAAMGLDSQFTYYDIVKTVQEFKCGATGLNAAGVKINVELNLYETEDAQEPALTVAEEEYTFTGNTDTPTVTVTPIEVEGLDVAYTFTPDQTVEEAAASAYKNYIADFTVSFDQDIPAGAVKLAGSYQGYKDGEWVEITLPALSAGVPYNLLENAVAAMGLDSQFTYYDIVKIVQEFKCGAAGLNAAGVKINVDLNLYENEGDQEPAITIADEDYTFPENTDTPTVTVTPIDVEGLDVAYSFTPDQTVDEAAISTYRNYIADFTVSFDKDIPAGAVKLAGSYQGYKDGEWVEISLPALEAGQPYRLLENAVAAMGLDSQFSYYDIVKIVQEFKCGAAGLDAAGVKITVDLNLYENEDAQEPSLTIAEEDYTFPAGNDWFSITIADEIALNIYVAKSASIAELQVTSNSTPEMEQDTQTTASYKGSALAALEDGAYYKVRVPLAPAQIRDAIKIDILDENGDAVRTPIEKTVADYCEDIIGGAYTGDDADEVMNLAQATLNYGAACADYFDYNTDAFAMLADAPVCEFADSYTSGCSLQDFCTSASFVAESVPEVRFTINATEEEAANLTVSAGAYSAKVAKVGDSGRIVIAVTGIPASKLDETITVTFSGSKTGTITYTPLYWAKKAAESNNQKLSRLGNALGLYHQAAAELF